MIGNPVQTDIVLQVAVKPLIQQRSVRRRPKVVGFTLIEVLIVVAIIGILAAIAVPSYSQYVTDARRTDAISFLSELAGEQARYFSNNNQYAMTMKELGYGDANKFVSPEGDYEISVSNSTILKFLLTATPVTDGRQASDAACTTFTISNTGQKKSTGTSDNCW